MIEDVVGGAFKLFGRFFGQMFIEIIFELLIKGPGYFIVKSLSKSDPDPDGFRVVVTGLIFWLVVGVGIYFIYTNLSATTTAVTNN